MEHLKVEIVSTSERIFSGYATFVCLPGEKGELGILPGHAPLITRIRPGMVRIKLKNGAEESVFIAGGMLEVQPDGVTVLADTAIRGKNIDEAKAQQARRQACQTLRNARSNFQYAAVQAELDCALARLAELTRLRRI